MSETTQQLILDLPHRPAQGAEDYIVSTSNAAAVKMIDMWPNWPGPFMLIMGPSGCGKTHLANVWSLKSNARHVLARNADEATILEAARGGQVVIEDIDCGIGDERALFHHLNNAKEHGWHVLITAKTPPGTWPIKLPDLRSRLRSLPVISIERPDESLLRAVLVKLLADRQLPATPAAVNHLARYMDRSMACAIALVDKIDKSLWHIPKMVTRNLASDVLAGLQSAADEGKNR